MDLPAWSTMEKGVCSLAWVIYLPSVMRMFVSPVMIREQLLPLKPEI
jgi:hypothetical protein